MLTLAGKRKELPLSSESLYKSELIAKAAQNTKNLIDEVRSDNPDLAKKLEGQEMASIPNLNQNQIGTNCP